MNMRFWNFMALGCVGAVSAVQQISLDPLALAQNVDHFEIRAAYQRQMSDLHWFDAQLALLRDFDCQYLGQLGKCSLRDAHMELGLKPIWHGMSAEPLVHMGYMSRLRTLSVRNKESFRNYYAGAELRIAYQYVYKSWVISGGVGGGVLYLPGAAHPQYILRPVLGLGWQFGTSAR